MSPPTAVGPRSGWYTGAVREPAVKERVARLLARIDRFQQRHRALGLPIAVFKRFGEHGGGRLAATISYYGFFSLFPLLLAFVTMLGLVLAGRPQPPGGPGRRGLRSDPGDRDRSCARTQLPGQGWVLALGLADRPVGRAGRGRPPLQHALDTIADVPVTIAATRVVRKGRRSPSSRCWRSASACPRTSSNLASVRRRRHRHRRARPPRHVRRQRGADRADVHRAAGPAHAAAPRPPRHRRRRHRPRRAPAARQLRRAPLHRRRQRHLRHVRHRHRPAQLVLPRQPRACCSPPSSTTCSPTSALAASAAWRPTSRPTRTAGRRCSTSAGSSATPGSATRCRSRGRWRRTTSRSGVAPDDQPATSR